MEIPTSLIEHTIHRGTIIHFYGFTDIDHGKFFVVVGVNADCLVGFFFINSSINRMIFGKQRLLDMQYPMKQTDYPFLRYDSFLCATNIMTIEKGVLAADIASGTASIVGEMKAAHLSELISAARKSDYSRHSPAALWREEVARDDAGHGARHQRVQERSQGSR